MNRIDWVDAYLHRQTRAVECISRKDVVRALEMVQEARDRGHRIFIVGNGGSAANASHFATDLGKGASDALAREGGTRFNVTSLTDNISWITALGNDVGYENVFSDQLKGQGARSGDLLIGASVSGTSPNLVKAFSLAKSIGMRTIALTRSGAGGKVGNIGQAADLWIRIVDDHYGVVEDAEMTVLHMLAYFFMENSGEARKGESNGKS